MKKTFNAHGLSFASSIILTVSCENKIAAADTITTKQHMEAEAKTIANMQSAYKGEITAVAKYVAFSKKAEEGGYHNIALLYNAVSAAENIHSINHKAVIEDAGATVPSVKPEFTMKTTKENLHEYLLNSTKALRLFFN